MRLRHRGWMLLGTAAVAVAAAWGTVVLPAVQRTRVASASTPEVIKIVRTYPQDTRLVNVACRRLLSMGDTRDVIAILTDLTAGYATDLTTGIPSNTNRLSDSDRAALMGLLAEAEILEGHTAAGLAHASSAMTLDADCIPAAAALAFWSERLANWPDAVSRLGRVALAAPEDDVVQYHLARALIMDGDFDRASDILKAAIHRHPGSYNNRVLMGVVQAYSGRFHDAAESFRQACRLHPRSFEARANAARANAFAARSPDQCQRQEAPISQLVRNDPDLALDQEILGMLELHAGDTVAAQGHLEAAARAYRSKPLSIRTYAPEIFKNLVIIHALNAHDEQASQDIKDASAFDRPLRSAARLKDWIAQRPEDPNLHLQLARQYESLDAPAEALNQYEELLRLNAYETVARSRIDALSARSVPHLEIEWAWRVLATETGLRFPSAQ